MKWWHNLFALWTAYHLSIFSEHDQIQKFSWKFIFRLSTWCRILIEKKFLFRDLFFRSSARFAGYNKLFRSHGNGKLLFLTWKSWKSSQSCFSMDMDHCLDRNAVFFFGKMSTFYLICEYIEKGRKKERIGKKAESICTFHFLKAIVE